MNQLLLRIILPNLQFKKKNLSFEKFIRKQITLPRRVLNIILAFLGYLECTKFIIDTPNEIERPATSVNKYPGEFSRELWNHIKSYRVSSKALKVQNLSRAFPSRAVEVLHARARIRVDKFSSTFPNANRVIRGFVNSFPRRENHIVISPKSLLVLRPEEKKSNNAPAPRRSAFPRLDVPPVRFLSTIGVKLARATSAEGKGLNFKLVDPTLRLRVLRRIHQSVYRVHRMFQKSWP